MLTRLFFKILNDSKIQPIKFRSINLTQVNLISCFSMFTLSKALHLFLVIFGNSWQRSNQLMSIPLGCQLDAFSGCHAGTIDWLGDCYCCTLKNKLATECWQKIILMAGGKSFVRFHQKMHFSIGTQLGIVTQLKSIAAES